MGKRRRERDRPKAPHDSLYDPNKRVMLSYTSDEEIEDGVATAAQSTARYVETENASEEPPEAEESDIESGSHKSLHRALFEEAWEDDGEDEEVEDAHGTTHGESLWARGTRKNAATGQWAALGSLAYQWEDGDGEEDEEFDSEDEEAMAYLRAVRSERQGMPMVFKAANTYSYEDIYESGDGDTRGYYEDGAYVGRGSLGQQLPTTEKVLVDPQEAFTRVLIQRFLKERDRMHLRPDPDALAALDTNHPISFPAKSNKAYAEWYRLLRTTVPLPAQIRAMERAEVFRLVELVQKNYLVRSLDIITNVSSWIWSLLARLDDVGTMDNDQVWAIRELGKKAVLVQVSFNNPAAAEQLERVAAEEKHGEKNSDRLPSLNPEESSTALAKLESEDSKMPHDAELEAVKTDGLTNSRQNTLATLDMIIVLVGEVFGQRDLLDFRQPWMEQEKVSCG